MVVNAIREGRGVQFEPALVDLLLNNLDSFNALRQHFPDECTDGVPDSN
jgi:response regulator RpfG family c-di-GMP phosphodiesterase